METIEPVLPVLIFIICVAGLAVVLLILGNLFNPRRPSAVKGMPYESGMDPIHDTRRRFGLRFYLVAIAFLVFDVELLFLYPWAVTAAPARVAVSLPDETTAASGQSAAAIDATAAALANSPIATEMLANQSSGLLFAAMMVFIGLLALGLIYDWRKGIFEWR